jgi:hypothetical protein
MPSHSSPTLNTREPDAWASREADRHQRDSGGGGVERAR